MRFSNTTIPKLFGEGWVASVDDEYINTFADDGCEENDGNIYADCVEE